MIWCHNGLGVEAPVAGVLGKVDAFNLFDNYWMDPEYDVYYQMLNAGIRLPVSTGSGLVHLQREPRIRLHRRRVRVR